MKAAVLTNRGIEDIAALEIQEKAGAGTPHEIADSVITFDVKDRDVLKLCELCYTGQSFSRVMILLNTLEFMDSEEIADAVKNTDFSAFITENTLFGVQCVRHGEHEFTSVDIENKVGKLLRGEFERSNPEVAVLIIIINSSCYIGIDLAGFDLSKRQYRMFMTAHELRANIAYALVRMAGYEKTKVLLDPFTRSGTLAIEAALHVSGLPVNYYIKDRLAFVHFDMFKEVDFESFFRSIDTKADMKGKGISITASDSQLGYVSSGQKNAKIAGVKNLIEFRRADVEWLDIKFKEESIDCVSSFVPALAERNRKATEKKIDQLFARCAQLMKKNGLILLATGSPAYIEAAAVKNGFSARKERSVMQGKQELSVIAITK